MNRSYAVNDRYLRPTLRARSVIPVRAVRAKDRERNGLFRVISFYSSVTLGFTE